jgi:hypothetical protein
MDICCGHTWLSSLQLDQRIAYGWQQACDHSAGEPKTKFLRILGVQAQQKPILAIIVADGQLVNVHSLILGNKAPTWNS